MLQNIENSNDKELIIYPSKLKKIMGKVDDRYNYNRQEDSNEFITNFITALLSETGNKEKKVKKLNIYNELEKRPYDNLYKKFYQRKGDSFILDLFYGIFKVTKICKKCNKINSIKFNVYNILEFPLCNLPKQNSYNELQLNDLLKDFISEKKSEDNCINCNSYEIYSKTNIYTLPKYLIIFFGRIYENKYYSYYIKYPKYFDIKGEYEEKEDNYVLDCVIEHSGGSSFGHYTSLIPLDRNNDYWVRYSDDYCSGKDTGFESKNAIILLYKLR